MAFTEAQVARLSGISQRRLRYWVQTGVYEPHYVEQRDNGPFRRIYAFEDLVNIRALARLRLSFDVPLHELRSVAAYVKEHSNVPWSRLAVRVYGNHLAFRDPRTDQWMTAEPAGQLIFELEFVDVRNESERDARALMKRSAEQHGRITRNRNVMSNEWVISGTRIPVSAVMSFHREGYTKVEILGEYPTLVVDDIDAAIAFEEQMRPVA